MELSAIRGGRSGKGKLEALTVFSQKIQAREKGGNKERGRRGSRAQGRVKRTREREERANQQEGGWREALVALARLWPEKPEANGKEERGLGRRKLRNKGQYRGVRSRRTNVQGAICSMDDTSL